MRRDGVKPMAMHEDASDDPCVAAARRFTVTYSEAIVRDAVRAFIWRRAIVEQKLMWAAAALLAVLLGYLIASGDRSWLVGVLAMVALAPPAVVLVAWRAHFANTVGRFRRMADRRAEIEFAAGGLRVASELGRGEIAWPAIVDLWERPQAWLVFTGRSAFNVVPFADIPEDARAWLRERLRPVLRTAG